MFRRFFYLSRSQIYGGMILIIGIIGVSIFNLNKKDYSKYLGDDITIDSPKKEIGDTLRRYKENRKLVEKEKAIEYFKFNPNSISKDSLLLLGLSTFQANNWVNYINKGGRFKVKTDVIKIYGIGKLDYEKLESWISIPTKKSKTVEFKKSKLPKKQIKKELKKVEINLADSTELIKIKGIGVVFAKRILKYRSLLGGFETKRQLFEVYGMDSIKYKLIENQILVDSSKIKKKNINQLTVRQLAKHPYINYHVAKAVIAYKEQHGDYRVLHEIKECDLVDDKLYSKIVPYFKAE